ncbi:MAG TPA: cellulase N-terminal Ig-like domain-containing protein, partial [Blastocatellia bacterium]|nr:cellulase N-terminal Ig-like domain-containing protein [Blastocatellia bacterium]
MATVGRFSTRTWSWERSLTWCVSLALVASAVSTSAPANTLAAFIRINQVGYVLDGPKRAYLMSNTSMAGHGFKVTGSTGITAFYGQVGPDLGSWGDFPHVYALDFDSVSSPDTYTIDADQPAMAVASPPFPIDTPANIYSALVANALSFFQNQRDGREFIPSALRTAPGHLNDEMAAAYRTPILDSSGGFSGRLKRTGAVIDASGGWWDAGDYLKFVETHSYTVSLML